MLVANTLATTKVRHIFIARGGLERVPAIAQYLPDGAIQSQERMANKGMLLRFQKSVLGQNPGSDFCADEKES